MASWTVVLEHYRRELVAAGRTPATIKLRLHYVRQLARMYPDRSPWSLTGNDLIAYMAAGRWGPESRKSARASVCGLYAYGIAAGHIDADPSRRLAPVRVPAGAPRPAPERVLMRALLTVDNDRDRLALLLAAYAGLRRAEISRVHPGDFTEHGLRVTGKGGRVRVVPVHVDLAAAVRAEVERRAAGGHGTGWRYVRGITAAGPLFPNASGVPVGADVIGSALSRWLGPGYTGHTLRHRFASSAYAAERDIRAVQELLGHSSPTTTARYVQTPATAKATAVNAVGIDAA